MNVFPNVIIADTLNGLGTQTYDNYLIHALCQSGTCRFRFNEKEFELHKGDLMIVRKGMLVDDIRPSVDFRVQAIYITAAYIERCTPQSNYGMKGQLALFLNPVMRLTSVQYERCQQDFNRVIESLADTNHHFYDEMLACTVQMLILDFFDFHSSLYGIDNISLQQATLMNRFLNMLENGDFRCHREISYYADHLCITSKYLSEISKKVSGYAAGYWIDRYTILDISRLLRDKSLTLTDISDLFGFSSLAYFSRYVQQHLGVSPSQYRE